MRMSGSSVMPAGSKRMPVNASTKLRSGTPYCRPWLTEMAKASMMPARVEPCFDTRTKISPGRPSSYSPTVTKPLQSATRNSKVLRAAGAGQLAADRLVDDLLDDALDDLGAAAGRGGVLGVLDAVLLGRRQRLGDLAVVAVDGDGLDAELPGVDVELLDLFDRDLLGHVHRLGDGAGDERLDRTHHRHVARVVDGVVAHRAGEHRRCARP